MPARIVKGDEVVVISGKDRGKQGKVLRIDPRKERVYVEGLNIIKRHTRPRPGSMEPGGVIEREGPIHLSNVALRDPKDKKPTRVKTIVEHGKRMRASARYVSWVLISASFSRPAMKLNCPPQKNVWSPGYSPVTML